MKHTFKGLLKKQLVIMLTVALALGQTPLGAFAAETKTVSEAAVSGAAVTSENSGVAEEPAGSEFYDRCRVNGGTSKYYTWPGDEIMAEWGRLDPVIKEIVEMG